MPDKIDFSAFPESKKLERIAEESAKGTVINFGWIPQDDMTDAQEKHHEEFLAEMPQFGIRGAFQLESRRYPLWQAIRNLLGKDPAWSHQTTGSCVGSAGCNLVIATQGVEIFINRDHEQYKWPWWLFTYGRSRFHGGMRGQGEGSFGSAWAKAVTTDGIFELDPEGEPDLPDPTIRNGWAQHPRNLELQWSDGGRIGANWMRVGKNNLFKTAARIRSTDQAIAAIANGYCLTVASMFGFSPMIPALEGRAPNQVRLVRRWNANWAHQMTILGFWDHPDLGPIFEWGNQWSGSAHHPGGVTPSGYPNCLFHVTQDVTERVLRDNRTEAYAFSSFDGFPAREEKLNFSAF